MPTLANDAFNVIIRRVLKTAAGEAAAAGAAAATSATAGRQRRRHPSLLPSELSTTPPSTRESTPRPRERPRNTTRMDREEFPPLGMNTLLREKEGNRRPPPPSRPPPPETDWERETRALDDQLTAQIEGLLERRRRLRETTDRVRNRPSLVGDTRIGRRDQSSSLPPPPLAGDRSDDKGRKKKKKKAKGGGNPASNNGNIQPSATGPAKGGIKVIEEVTLRGRDVIPASRFQPEETWVEVVRRRPKRATTTTPTTTNVRPPPPPVRQETAQKVKLQRTPNSSAVTMTCPPGRYEAFMRQAKASIKLEEIEISKMRFKRAVTGALTLEILVTRMEKRPTSWRNV